MYMEMDAIGIAIILPCAEVSIGLIKLAVSWHLTLAVHVAKQRSKLAHLTLPSRTLTMMAVLGMKTSEMRVVFSILMVSLQQPIAVNVLVLQL